MSQITYNSEKITKKRVRFTAAATEVLKAGYMFCYNADYGTATESDQSRAVYVEKPAAGNLQNFAGWLSEGQAGKSVVSGETYMLDLVHPTARGQKIPVFTDQNCTIDSTVLTLVAGQWYAGGVSEGPEIGRAMQTVDRSSTNGTVLALVGSVGSWSVPVAGTGYSAAIWDNIDLDGLRKNPGLGILYENDFLDADNLTTAEGWTISQTTTGTLSLVAEEGGVLKADSAGSTTADDGVQAQLLNCRVLPAAGRKIAFEARVKMNDATDQYFVGLAATDTTLIAAGVLDDASDKIGFYHEAASTDNKISSVCARTTADDKTADVAANVDDTYAMLGFVQDGLTSAKFYVNGVLVETGTTTASLPNAALCLSLASQIEVAGADAELSVDYVRVAQTGGRS